MESSQVNTECAFSRIALGSEIVIGGEYGTTQEGECRAIGGEEAVIGVAPSTAGNKAGEIRKLVRMSPWDTEWLLKELAEDNPAIWMLSVDGFIVDARDLPLEIQQEAVRRGLIPYVPAPRQKEKQPEQHSEKADIPAPNPLQDCASDDSTYEPAPPADFSDIYDRFRTI